MMLQPSSRYNASELGGLESESTTVQYLIGGKWIQSVIFQAKPISSIVSFGSTIDRENEQA